MSKTMIALLDDNGEMRDPGTGRDVADFLAQRAPVCPVIIHTSNQMARAGMELALKDSGWNVTRVFPSADLDWIRTEWMREVNALTQLRKGPS